MSFIYIMDSMLGDDKNLKDTLEDSTKDTSSNSTSLILSWQNHSGSYTKINKLITALYMVTDTMDKKEPIRLRLRTLGAEILSDINSLNLPKEISSNGHIDQKIITILAFLNIASDVKMASEMNCDILIKEFAKLKESIQEFMAQNHLWLEEFILNTSSSDDKELHPNEINPSNGHNQFMSDRRKKNLSSNKGQGVSIGVQKGSTLLNALSRIKKSKNLNGNEKQNKFEAVKEQRRKTIIRIIKNKPNGASIKDIILAVNNLNEKIGEKTIQRELVSMVSDSILYRTGSKRWSRYFLKQ